MVRSRILIFLVLLSPALAAAQQENVAPEPELPASQPVPPSYSTSVVGESSPQATQDRNFTSTRFWRLDPGVYEAEAWWRTRTFKDGDPEYLFQVEAEIGLTRHLQLDVYENLQYAGGELTQEGNQIEARISIPGAYGEMFMNPTIYLEWHPRHGDADRAEVRLLLGGAVSRHLYLVMNPYVESNVERTAGAFVADAEVGSTFAAGYTITDWFRVSAQAKIGGDMLGDPSNQLHFVWYLGPGFILKPLKTNALKVMFTALFAMPGTKTDLGAQTTEPQLIIGSEF